ncbi:hypothetical protein Nepgr_020297 [Nepenthes gracilis]|uniref:Uncharacterized protein n=1 Tax=Nepenthes gracilis TaxID=150966 RepID=A0AAD3SYT3_NEPGR|nr:hypothetical protein Nepgr_020297 [Nepenthes gracilis]
MPTTPPDSRDGSQLGEWSRNQSSRPARICLKFGSNDTSLAPYVGSPYEKPTTLPQNTLFSPLDSSAMVNTRAQTSDPARNATFPDQDHTASTLARIGLKSALGAQRREKVWKEETPDTLGRRIKTQFRSKPPGLPGPRVDKIWNYVFKDDEHTVDLDRSPFIAEILNRPLSTKFKMPFLDSYDGNRRYLHLVSPPPFRIHQQLLGAYRSLPDLVCLKLTGREVAMAPLPHQAEVKREPAEIFGPLCGIGQVDSLDHGRDEVGQFHLRADLRGLLQALGPQESPNLLGGEVNHPGTHSSRGSQ